MTTREKIEKKGYKVIYHSGFKNGVQTIVSVTASKLNGLRLVTKPNITQLYKALFA